jgi:hypothetical protein
VFLCLVSDRRKPGEWKQYQERGDLIQNVDDILCGALTRGSTGRHCSWCVAAAVGLCGKNAFRGEDALLLVCSAGMDGSTATLKFVFLGHNGSRQRAYSHSINAPTMKESFHPSLTEAAIASTAFKLLLFPA